MAEKPIHMAKPRKKKALGRGLNALIPDLGEFDARRPDYRECDIHRIRPNRYQPRRRFDPSELEELRDSIREQGILQPLLVREDGGNFEIIAGERRLRAAKLAGLQKVPVVIRQVDDVSLLELSIIENIQREDLNPMEESEAYHRLITVFGLTQDSVAARVGKSRPTVTNAIRLRSLPGPIKESIRSGDLGMGHARALLGADGSARQMAAWRKVISLGLSVRATESLVKALKKPKEAEGKPAKTSDDVYFADLADELARKMGTRVRIHRKGKRGRLEIEFYGDEDLDRLIQLLRAI